MKLGMPMKLNLKIALPGDAVSVESPWIQKLRQYDLQQDPKIYAFAESLFAKILHFSRSHPHIRRHCPHCVTGATDLLPLQSLPSQSQLQLQPQSHSHSQSHSQSRFLQSHYNPITVNSPTQSINYPQTYIPATPNENETTVESHIYSNNTITPLPVSPSFELDESSSLAITPMTSICCYYNILFLDADGVIVPTKSLKEFPSEEHMLRLKRIIDEHAPHLSVVISSSWRSSPDHLYSLCAAFHEIGIDYQKTIIGCIPSCKDESMYKSHAEERNACIQAWFKQLEMEYVEVVYDENCSCYKNPHPCKGHSKKSSSQTETNIMGKTVTEPVRKEEHLAKMDRSTINGNSEHNLTKPKPKSKGSLTLPSPSNIKKVPSTPSPSNIKNTDVKMTDECNNNNHNNNNNNKLSANKGMSIVTSIKLPSTATPLPQSTTSNHDYNNSTPMQPCITNNNGINNGRKVMKMWRSKSPHFYVYNYLIVDDFGLGGRMIDHHFLRTQSNVGMTEKDLETILDYFRNPPPPGPIVHRKKTKKNKGHKLYTSAITPLSTHTASISDEQMSEGRPARSKGSIDETIENEQKEDQMDQKDQEQDLEKELEQQEQDHEYEHEHEYDPDQDQDQDHDHDQEDEEDEWEEEWEETPNLDDALASIDPDILMMIPSAQD